MNIILKFIISLFIVTWFYGLSAYSQNLHFYGLDISKTISNKLVHGSTGFVMEPIYVYKPDSSLIRFKSAFGYSSVYNENVYINSNIKTDGFYIKAAFGNSKNEFIVPYLGVFASVYTIHNSYTLKGSYFGDITKKYTHNHLFALGPEFNLDLTIKVSKNFYVAFTAHFNYVVLNTESEGYPVFYVPGAGFVNSNRYSIGISVALLYSSKSK